MKLIIEDSLKGQRVVTLRDRWDIMKPSRIRYKFLDGETRRVILLSGYLVCWTEDNRKISFTLEK